MGGCITLCEADVACYAAAVIDGSPECKLWTQNDV